ncbi:MAG: potassium channel family protein [Pseudomonadota bacterium]|nr:potassium channel family protein [Pseudomonadota bacterium]
MFVLQKVFGALRQHVRRVSWAAVCLLLVAHMLSTWVLLTLAGERELVGLNTFPYYFMTTATTIGYGDLSPSTVAGRYVVAFWMMPMAVALFGTVLAKTSASLTAYWRRHQVGQMTYSELAGHTVVVGWRPVETGRLIQLLLSDSATDDEGIILVAHGLAENPHPDHVRFVATASYAECEGYERACVATAGRIIINCGDDDQAIAAVFAVMALDPVAHVVVRFDSPAPARLVSTHYPQVECTRPMIAEIIARAAQDPGSAAVTSELLSVESGPTQFSLQLPGSTSSAAYSSLVELFKARSATLLGYRRADSTRPLINPGADATVEPGSILYYLATTRIDAESLDWGTARS